MEKYEQILTDMRVDIAEIRKDLAHHIYRTELAEKGLQITRQELKLRMEPVERHIHRIEGVVKAVGIFALLAGIGSGLYTFAMRLMG